MTFQKIINECHWEITKRCNLSCIHCIAATGSYKELDTNDSLRVIDNLSSLGCQELYITGGEPLIRNDIFNILEKAKEKKFRVGLLTNSVLLSKKNVKKIKLLTDEIGISLDGSSAEVNDMIRGNGSFDKIIDSISLIRKYSIPFSLYTTINNYNIDDLENILELSNKLGAKSTRLNEITLRGRALKYKKRLMIPRNRQITLNGLFGKNHYFGMCDINPKTIFLSPMGLIYPCIEIFQSQPSNFIGNILNITSNFLKNYQELHLRDIKARCPYHVLMGKKSVIACLNNHRVKCPFTIKNI